MGSDAKLSEEGWRGGGSRGRGGVHGSHTLLSSEPRILSRSRNQDRRHENHQDRDAILFRRRADPALCMRASTSVCVSITPYG